MKYVLFNSLANSSNCEENINGYVNKLGDNVKVLNVIDLVDYKAFFDTLNNEDEVHLLGGDGTLNKFINIANGQNVLNNLPCKFYFSGSGTGNDFCNDLKDVMVDDKILLNDYLNDLPLVTVKEKDYLFINGIGFGIDGYCCEVADELHKKSNKPVDYSKIAINGLLFHYKRPNAKVTVDGVTKTYKNVYLAATMKGKCYGGGMLVAPNQNRSNPDKKVSVVVLHGCSRLKALMIFPSLFKGTHVSYTKNIDIIEGHNVEVEFDIPTALQIDGETIKEVTNYKVSSK